PKGVPPQNATSFTLPRQAGVNKGKGEADVKTGRISTVSPVGRALIGKEEGDEVRIQAPGRTVEYEILDITYK
ncbi:MAG TPA: hypothetical protein ENI12_06255, partial [Nitrospirae bacterium]|nr:hypothetical protein [Nitrospirota bacterium]